MKGNRLARVLKIAPFALLMFALFVFVVMQLWNWLMPALFGLKLITYWQALGLLVLSKILFGGFRGGHGRGSGGGGGWRHRMRLRAADAGRMQSCDIHRAASTALCRAASCRAATRG